MIELCISFLSFLNVSFFSSPSLPPPQKTADLAIEALELHDVETFSDLVHPQKGVVFSPYAFIQPDAQHFTPETITLVSNDQYLWGYFAGSGEPIQKTFVDYIDTFVVDKPFLQAPEISFNQQKARGNSLSNIQELFPHAVFIEYYFPQFDPQYEGMDWESLRVLLEQQNGKWYVVAMVHDQWTP